MVGIQETYLSRILTAAIWALPPVFDRHYYGYFLNVHNENLRSDILHFLNVVRRSMRASLLTYTQFIYIDMNNSQNIPDWN